MALRFAGNKVMYCYRTLKTLGETIQPLNIGQIDGKTVISFEHLRESLKTLVNQKYVSKTRNRHQNIYQITPEGRKLLETLDKLNS